jgi:sucrose-6-phosphate hydrolase SacC (GH32 family)
LFLEQQLLEKSAAEGACNRQQNATGLQYVQQCEEWKEVLQSSEDKATTLRGLLDESTVEVTRLGALRNQERTSFSQQIFTERDRLAQYKKEVEVYCANQDKAIGGLRSKLEY